MPSGGSAATRLPSNSTVPAVAGVSPAITSSSVDLPQPDGPTTAKNSPGAISRSIGPSACSGAPVGVFVEAANAHRFDAQGQTARAG